MDRPRGEYEHTDVKSGDETWWNDYPSKGFMRAEDVDGGRGRRSKGGGASTPSHRLLYTIWICGEQTDALGFLFCSGRVLCSAYPGRRRTDNRRCSPPMRQPSSLKSSSRGRSDSPEAGSDTTDRSVNTVRS